MEKAFVFIAQNIIYLLILVNIGIPIFGDLISKPETKIVLQKWNKFTYQTYCLLSLGFIYFLSEGFRSGEIKGSHNAVALYFLSIIFAPFYLGATIGSRALKNTKTDKDQEPKRPLSP